MKTKVYVGEDGLGIAVSEKIIVIFNENFLREDKERIRYFNKERWGSCLNKNTPCEIKAVVDAAEYILLYGDKDDEFEHPLNELPVNIRNVIKGHIPDEILESCPVL